MQQRHRLEEHLLEVVQGVIHLIEYRWFELVQLIGAPPEPDFLLQLLTQYLAVLNRSEAAVAPL